MRLTLALSLALTAAACGLAPPPPVPTDLSQAGLPRTGQARPAEPEGACWSAEVLPARVETVTEQVQVQPARIAADGTVREPAGFRTETRQKILAERRAVWIEVPCEEMMTVGFVASLQRALKARGFYAGAPTGVLDAPTRTAVRAWQRSNGLDTATVSMAGARALGLIEVEQ